MQSNLDTMILLIETTTNICSVGIVKNGELLVQQEATKKMSHASQLTLTIQAVLKTVNIEMTGLEAVAVSIGPGSYTGLRIGLSTAKGICYALSLPLIAVNTLKALAWKTSEKYPEADLYAPMIDARRMEVYTALYQKDGTEILERQAKIIDTDSFSDLLETGKQIVFSGNGAAKCSSTIVSDNAKFVEIYCQSENLASLAQEAFDKKDFADLAYIEPYYLKSPNITKPKKLL